MTVLLWNGKLLCLTVKISIRLQRTSAKLDQMRSCDYLMTLQQRGKILRLHYTLRRHGDRNACSEIEKHADD
ncbi:hypothetical protein ACS0TY_017022 [Phlomoides rotata]